MFEYLVLVESLVLSWLAMQAVHELGHVLHAWYSGGKVVQVVLTPLDLSRTDVQPNPHPQFVAWGGPIWGCALPALGWLIVRVAMPTFALPLKFFTGFCLIANGIYISAGAAAGMGDAADMVRHGAPRWLPLCAGVVAFAAGLYLWHTLGPRLGTRKLRDSQLTHTAVVVAALIAGIIAIELAFAGSTT